MSFNRLEDYSFVKTPNSMFAIMYSFPLAVVDSPRTNPIIFEGRELYRVVT
jgi:hypothetical protein